MQRIASEVAIPNASGIELGEAIEIGTKRGRGSETRRETLDPREPIREDLRLTAKRLQLPHPPVLALLTARPGPPRLLRLIDLLRLTPDPRLMVEARRMRKGTGRGIVDMRRTGEGGDLP